MNILNKTLTVTLLTLAPIFASAQYMEHKEDSKKAEMISVSADTVTIDYNNGVTNLAVLSNCDYMVTTTNTWFKILKEQRDNIALFGTYNFDLAPRFGSITLTSTSGNFVRNVVVKQTANSAADDIKGDTRLKITGEASQQQTGEGIERSYDGNNNTLWHSPYSGTTFPITLTYTLDAPQHISYMMYTPRQDGNTNGLFKSVTIEYALADQPNSWIKQSDPDLSSVRSTSRIDFGTDGIANVSKVRIVVNSGEGNFASCAEIGFYQKDMETTSLLSKYFSDDVYSVLRAPVSESEINSISNPLVKQLVNAIGKGNYSTAYRVGTFEPYRPIGELSTEFKTSTYNAYENPTGIYFDKDQSMMIFATGIGNVKPKLIIKSFGPESYVGEKNPESSYELANGLNVIKTKNRGNGYISYYTSNYKTSPNVKLHFVMAKENGYFDLARGDNNDDWKTLLANACSDIIDVRTPHLQVAFTTKEFKARCPEKGLELALLYDSIVYREHEVMGLKEFGRAPKNRQFARCAPGGMFADGVGAGANYGSIGGWVNPNNFDFWGLGHELGHVNQVRPGLKWVGCGETTNNIYSAWVNFKLGNKWLRLEDERTGINDYGGLRGGRFNAHLDEGVRKGIFWQLQNGPDYNGSTPEPVTVADEDYEGNELGNVNTTKRNYDHFVKVVPMYQLLLYTQEAKQSVGAYGKVIEGIRTYPNENQMSNGQLQMKFIRSFCDSTKINFLPFFEKAGMLRPINAYIEDYSRGWIKISEKMISDLKSHVAESGYAEAPAGLNFINGYNWKTFRDKAPLVQATLNEGCVKQSSGRIQIDHEVWKNVVGFETYNAEGTLLRISMFGLGAAEGSSRYTQALWPNTTTEKSAYIMAVGFDGKRYKCYQP